MNILIFGGTTEGRLLPALLSAAGHTVTVSVATELGREELNASSADSFTVLCGRLDENEMEMLLHSKDLCIDATHPYSIEVRKNIQSACRLTGTRLIRLLRNASSSADDCLSVPDCKAAAEYLSMRSGNILLATGSKDLAQFSGISPERLFVRILPTHAGLSACEELGIPHRNIIAMQGPFSVEMNLATIRQYSIHWMVTKDGGSAGGFDEKLQAAREAGAELILVRRPEDRGMDFEEIVHMLCKSEEH